MFYSTGIITHQVRGAGFCSGSATSEICWLKKVVIAGCVWTGGQSAIIAPCHTI